MYCTPPLPPAHPPAQAIATGPVCALPETPLAVSGAVAVMLALEAIDGAQRCMRAEIAQKGQQVAALEARNGENAALLGALKLALVTIDAFWPNDRPENQAQVDEDRAIAKVRKLARAAIAEAKKENK